MWKPDESAEHMFHLLWQMRLVLSHSDRFAPKADPVGQIINVYLIWDGLETMTDRGADQTVKLGSADQI